MSELQVLDMQLSIITLVVGVVGSIAYGSKIIADIKEQRRIKKILKEYEK